MKLSHFPIEEYEMTPTSSRQSKKERVEDCLYPGCEYADKNGVATFLICGYEPSLPYGHPCYQHQWEQCSLCLFVASSWSSNWTSSKEGAQSSFSRLLVSLLYTVVQLCEETSDVPRLIHMKTPAAVNSVIRPVAMWT